MLLWPRHVCLWRSGIWQGYREIPARNEQKCTVRMAQRRMNCQGTVSSLYSARICESLGSLCYWKCDSTPSVWRELSHIECTLSRLFAFLSAVTFDQQIRNERCSDKNLDERLRRWTTRKNAVEKTYSIENSIFTLRVKSKSSKPSLKMINDQ